MYILLAQVKYIFRTCFWCCISECKSVFYFLSIGAQYFQMSCIFSECGAESTNIYPWRQHQFVMYLIQIGWELKSSTCVLSVTSKPVICCHICRSLTERFLSAKDCTQTASSNFNPDSCLSLCCLLQLPTFYPPHITWDNMQLVTKYSLGICPTLS